MRDADELIHLWEQSIHAELFRSSLGHLNLFKNELTNDEIQDKMKQSFSNLVNYYMRRGKENENTNYIKT
ncbi:hypothetical protein HMPREF0083_00785 [Aneurinibacillus aneurinilyticus ATCC 12856]|jgi:hypothetical protein|uniref:Uncharacterized protein n=1 Tax=Aneurinibacillus aneurinilyticus ATCC 12856 TaxID=649747 RepID=U1YJZ2_ANEAE|nr:hypothetical protein HMPREF0083_00785 [Aneurinibacillus aneurinilyticus ATCC 12856]